LNHADAGNHMPEIVARQWTGSDRGNALVSVEVPRRLLYKWRSKMTPLSLESS
jgi:hypothetical protein